MYHPKDKGELIACIKDKIEQYGLGTEDISLDLNDIDTSEITDMSELFDATDGELKYLSKNGYFDISDWNVNNVEDMTHIFTYSAFDGDISRWDVSSVKTMQSMFSYSKFTGKNGDISDWDVSSVGNMRYMFYKSNFNGDIKNWNVSNVYDMQYMFYKCPLYDNPPKWYKG